MAKKSGSYYLSQAEKAGLTVKPGKGDHFKMYGTDPRTGNSDMMICPLNLKGNGTECAIRKWLIRMGVVLAGVLFMALRNYLMGI